MIIRLIFIVSLCLSLLLPFKSFPEEPDRKTIFRKDSLYQYIAVIEDTAKKTRYIYNNRRDVVQGGIYIENPDRLLIEYTQMAFVSLAFLRQEPKRVLFVGLGVGAMPRYFSRYYPGVEIDIAEIDPDILEVAKKYFYFNNAGKMKVHIEDGRVFVKRTPQKYDIIFLDAYQNGDIPFHLTTAEFLREVRKKLNENGIIVTNIITQYKNRFFDSMVETYKQEFPHLYAFKGRKTYNSIFVVTKNNDLMDKETFVKNINRIQSLKKFDYDLREIADSYEDYTKVKYDAKILTDDFAPVNLYQHMKSP